MLDASTHSTDVDTSSVTSCKTVITIFRNALMKRQEILEQRKQWRHTIMNRREKPFSLKKTTIFANDEKYSDVKILSDDQLQLSDTLNTLRNEADTKDLERSYELRHMWDYLLDNNLPGTGDDIAMQQSLLQEATLWYLQGASIEVLDTTTSLEKRIMNFIQGNTSTTQHDASSSADVNF